jgi:flavodoxin I
VARAVVIYESLTGNTARAARLIADEVAARGVEVAVYDITDIGLKELAEADVVFIGTWVDGLVLFGHRPGRAGRIKRMPVVDGKPVAAFMTYAIHAGKALDRFSRVLTERGAVVVARALLRRDHLDQGIDELVSQALATVAA